MPTTASGIWTPDDSDDWDLTVDWAANANSIEAAISGFRRAASGTSAPMRAQYETYQYLTVNLPAGRFTSPPTVVISPAGAPPSRYNGVIWQVTTVTASSFQIRTYMYNNTSTWTDVTFRWVAVQN